MSAPLDPRDLTGDTHTGHVMRDGAVDPLPKDFLGPTNAGEPGQLGNPHGPTVVSPGIHALDQVHGITPGLVSSTPATQEADELEDLAEWQPQTVPEEDPTP